MSRATQPTTSAPELLFRAGVLPEDRYYPGKVQYAVVIGTSQAAPWVRPNVWRRDCHGFHAGDAAVVKAYLARHAQLIELADLVDVPTS